ncbi:MAG: diaminopimelate epimerase [Spirochaetes bacterium]|nr:diaminopimelate epimerase [Spirochaetota bacterium]
MKLPFTKMHGAGNDYVYIDCFANKVDDPAALAIRLSDRHFGIGGDGIILITPSDKADARMRMFNADGSESEMCGNGVRCVAKYVHDRGIAKKDTLRIETGRGVLDIKLTVENGAVTRATVDMGVPVLDGRAIPTTLDMPRVINHPVTVGGKTYRFTSVSMGNPHAVIYVDDVAKFPVSEVGPLIENHPLFPRRVNVEFVEKISMAEVRQRTWERGSGETLACGTGASAVCVAGVLSGMTGNDIAVHLSGGDLAIRWPGEGASVAMTGNAVIVFDGVIDI